MKRLSLIVFLVFLSSCGAPDDTSTTSSTATDIPTLGAVSAANTTIVAAPASVTADGVSTSTITVQAKDGSSNNLTASAGLVTLASTGSGSISVVTDNTDGTYTATVTNTVAEGMTISGTIAGNAITDTAAVTFTASTATGILSISWVAPLEREDGTPLILSEIETYNVYYGINPGDYQNQIDISDVAIDGISIPDFPSGTYYFVITTVTTDGLESRYSEEVRVQI